MGEPTYCVIALDGTGYEIEGVAAVFGPFDRPKAEQVAEKLGRVKRGPYHLIEHVVGLLSESPPTDPAAFYAGVVQ